MNTIILIFDKSQTTGRLFEMNQLECLIDCSNENNMHIVDVFKLSEFSEMMAYIKENHEQVDAILYDLNASFTIGKTHYCCWFNDVMCYNLSGYNIALMNDCDIIDFESCQRRKTVQNEYNSGNSFMITEQIRRSSMPIIPVHYIKKENELTNVDAIEDIMRFHCFNNEMYFHITIEEINTGHIISPMVLDSMIQEIELFTEYDEDIPLQLLTNNIDLKDERDTLRLLYEFGFREIIFFYSIPFDDNTYVMKFRINTDEESLLEIEFVAVSNDFLRHSLN